MCVPLFYRPISPLAAPADHELSDRAVVCLRGGFRILVAECLAPDDPIFDAQAHAWEHLRQAVSTLPGVTFDIVPIASAEALNERLTSEPIDVLILSAHGDYDTASGQAGIRIGTERWLGFDLASEPHLVILSACSAMPRGRAAINIGDVLLYRGVLAVLGPLIPVDFVRNADLLSRLFQYVHHSIEGRESCRTLAEAWRAALLSNVLQDAITGSEQFRQWAQLEWEPLADAYVNDRTEGRIRVAHSYADVEALLTRYATARGVTLLFEAALRPRAYFPEGLFYMLTGRPERIILRDEDLERARAQVGLFDRLGR